MTDRNILVVEYEGASIEERPVEIVERKGIGHPDSLCDGIAERVSVEYTKWCLENLGRELHHNFDKVQLVAGDVAVSYGHAELLKPIRLQIAGRGTPEAVLDGDERVKVPIDTIAINAAKAHIRETMKYLDPDTHCVIDCYAGRGSVELTHAVHEVTANDTSFGVAHWPRSGLENAVYELCQYINYDLLDEFPIGEDVKVMGARFGGEIVLTAAVPFIAPQIADADAYVAAKHGVSEKINAYAKQLDDRVARVDLNTADEDGTANVYLTLTGTSAEMGDDGSVGRGNRVTGVIAPFRSASLEAAAGKNPISHVGKLYNILAMEASKDIIEEVEEVSAIQIYILSQIGKPLDRPLVATATIEPLNGKISEAGKQRVYEILDTHLSDMTGLREKLAQQTVTLY
jgi:S-adenosylmethionine synthetase